MYSGVKKTNSYAQVGVETAVMSASPHQLITLLFDGALNSLARAKILIEQGEGLKQVTEKGNAISKSIGIIDGGLRAALNRDINPELVDNLDSLYEYMTSKLIEANLHNDVASIELVIKLLSNIADAWKQIDPDRPKTQ